MVDQNGLLMIEPKAAPTAPIVDATTMRITATLRAATHGRRFRGMHRCTGAGCRAMSDNREWFVVVNGHEMLTNSLAIHYVACHRREVPGNVLSMIDQAVALLTPTQNELSGGG